jgi:hypothetical protein
MPAISACTSSATCTVLLSGLTGDVEQYSRFTVCCYGRIHRLHTSFDSRDVPNSHRRATLCRLDNNLPKLRGIADLSGDEREVKLVDSAGVDRESR